MNSKKQGKPEVMTVMSKTLEPFCFEEIDLDILF